MTTTTTARRTERPKPVKDAVLLGAVDLARAAAEEIAGPGEVGPHLAVLGESERLVTHYFDSLAKGYHGWRWAVTVARAPRARVATICEAELLPGDGALLAPEWVPWADRLRPGDLGPSDTLPYQDEDPRLEPGYTATSDEDADAMAIYEFGLGRSRVLSPEGRDEAATRWYEGDHGPKAPSATATRGQCSTCGFLLRIDGSLRTVFGVCANEWSPDDGRVVSMDHGCGAHSETDAAVSLSEWAPSAAMIVDDSELEFATIEQVSGDETSAGDAASTDDAADATPTDGTESTDGTQPTDGAEPTDGAAPAADVVPEAADVAPDGAASADDTATAAPDDAAADEEAADETPLDIAVSGDAASDTGTATLFEDDPA